MSRLTPLPLALLLICCLPLACAPSAPAPGYVTFDADVMSTTVRVTVPASEQAADDAEAVFAVFRGVDARMSEWKESSPLAAVNHAAGDGPVAVPADLVEILERSVQIARLTDGAFDPTWAALWGLWDFRAAEPTVPAAADVEQRAALVDYRRLEIDAAEGTVRLPEAGMQLGLGGIAKGYALDRAVETLRRRGLDSFLLVAGGQVYAVGTKRGGSGGAPDRPWRVGIRDPRGAADDFFAEIELTDASASTSGDYESFFLRDGVRYHHVLDPRSGRPARSGVTGATVVSADATLADALSTALVVMGEERGLALVGDLDGVEALVVRTTGEWRATPALEQALVLRHPPRAPRP